ncbi:Signal peptidase complex subunit [Sorochytrium milnesiophthora]
MHSLTSRLNIIFSAASTVLCVVAAIVAITSYAFLPVQPTQPEISVSSVRLLPHSDRLRTHFHNYFHRPAHYGLVHFNLTADFTPVFNWNVKQVFAYLVLEYSTPGFERNQIVLWDTIIQNKDDAHLVVAEHNEYAINDFKYQSSRRLDNQAATLKLAWNVMPHVGVLQDYKAVDGNAGTTAVVFPALEQQQQQQQRRS